jgi:hypothetical protein
MTAGTGKLTRAAFQVGEDPVAALGPELVDFLGKERVVVHMLPRSRRTLIQATALAAGRMQPA